MMASRTDTPSHYQRNYAVRIALDAWNFLLKCFEKELDERDIEGGKTEALKGLL